MPQSWIGSWDESWIVSSLSPGLGSILWLSLGWYLEVCPDVFLGLGRGLSFGLGLGLVIILGLGFGLRIDGRHLNGNNVYVSHLELFVWGKKFQTKLLYSSRILYVFSLK